jgi:hypothetical protein
MSSTPLFRQLPTPKKPKQSNDSLIAGSEARGLSVGAGVEEEGAQADHYSTLAQMVTELSGDHAQLRTFIYEYARVKLRTDLYPLFVDGAWSEINEHMCRLEAAIDQIEADFVYDGLPASSPLALPDLTGRRAGNLLASRSPGVSASDKLDGKKTNTFGADAIHDRSMLFPSRGPTALPSFFGAKRSQNFWRNIQIAGAVVIGLVLFAVVDFQSLIRRSHQDPPREAPINTTRNSNKEGSVASPDKTVAPSSVAKLPSRLNDPLVPKEYGAYAVVNGKLAELEQLSIRVPDPRVAISAAIQTPSRTHLPAGQIQFIIFRRDLMNNAPDRVTVRVMAQIVKALSFDSHGNAKTSQVEQSWVIRNNSYPMKVAPLGDNPEMIVIRSDPPDLSLPAGRYILVLKSVGYDFTVDGGATDQAHCLERTDALSAPIYTECRKL